MAGKKVNRVVLIVLDSVGIGNAPDASKYNDMGANTLGHIMERVPSIQLPNLSNLGLDGINGSANGHTLGAFGVAQEVSVGKDTTSGHWEIAGAPVSIPFPVYPKGFPADVMEEIERRTGTRFIGNKVGSGTDIINELGDEHVRTGYPILYTSADSVFQVAAHEAVVPLERLYHYCAVAREVLTGSHAVGRVIARPFVGESGNYERTTNRKDFSLKPFDFTVLNQIEKAGKAVKAVGKVSEIFAGEGITESIKTVSNMDGVRKTIDYINEPFEGLIFTNLVDFDTLYGHRRDVMGYANALQELDNALPDILASLKENDVLIITADHGNDPTAPGSDHTREQVPVLVYGKHIKSGANIGLRNSFADIGATVAELLNVEPTAHGKSFVNDIYISAN